MADYRIKRWKAIRWIMIVLIIVTAVIVIACKPDHYDSPVHLTAYEPVISEILPPAGQEEDSYCKYYTVEFDLENLGGEPISLDAYRLDYNAKNKDFWVRSVEERSDANVSSTAYVPCGVTVHFKDVIRVSTYGEEGDIFPIELHYDDYDINEHLLTFEDPAE